MGQLSFILGTFSPVLSNEFMGSSNLLKEAHSYGVSLILLALISLILVYYNMFRGLLITGSLSLVLILAGFFHVVTVVTQLKAELAKSKFLGDVLGDSKFEYGWVVLLIGASMIILGGVKSTHRKIIP